MANRKYYDTGDLELVKVKLSGILTQEESVISELVRTHHQYEIRPLADAFAAASRDLSRQWTSAILGQVPPDAWVSREDGEMHVVPTADASLRFLTLTAPPETDAEVHRQIKFREAFFSLLASKIPTRTRRVYSSLLAWQRFDEVEDEGLVNQPLSYDIAFGHNLNWLERTMDSCLSYLEQNWVKANRWPTTQSLPPEVLNDISEYGLRSLKKVIEKWLCDDAELIGATQNSLLALTMANVAANRVMLEFAGLDARGAEAAEMLEVFLRELNAVGIDEVPDVMHGLAPADAKEMLTIMFNKWFGHGGSVHSSGAFFARAMAPAEVDLVVEWAVQVQSSYIRGRGHRGGIETHGGSCHLFIFALGIVAAFFTKAKVPNEFTGKKSPTHSIFPARSAISAGECASPSVHALKFLEQAYGLIFFGNSDWDIKPDGVVKRANVTSLRRVHLQQLVHFAVKGRTSGELLALNGRLAGLAPRTENMDALQA